MLKITFFYKTKKRGKEGYFCNRRNNYFKLFNEGLSEIVIHYKRLKNFRRNSNGNVIELTNAYYKKITH